MKKFASTLFILFFAFYGSLLDAQVIFCESFDDSIVSSHSDVFNTFYYHQNTWLNHWQVTDGTPSVFDDSGLTGVSSYQGIQYAGVGVCGGNNGCDGLELIYNFQANHTYQLSLADRNWNNYQVVVTFYLLPTILTHNYDSTAGCSNQYCGVIPTGAVQVFSSSPPNVWRTESFSFTPTSNYQCLWFSISTSSSIPNGSAAVFCFDSICLSRACFLPSIYLSNDTTLCTAQTLLLDATNPNCTYHWQDNSTNATFNVISAGTYAVTVTDASGCSASDSIHVNYTSDKPVFTLGNDTVVCSSEGLLLKPGIPNVQYHWQDNSTDSIYNVISSGTYSVTVSNGCGSTSDDIKIEVHLDECKLNVPTAFTPNGDGINDLFRGISRCETKQYTLHVFNRWGEQVFETQNISDGWDGTYKNKPQPMGVFVYYIEYFNYCENKLKKITGNVSLLR